MYPARPTIRCFTDDLGLALPTFDVDLCRYEHPILRKTRDLAPQLHSLGRLLCVQNPICYKFPFGRSRCGAWREPETSTFCRPHMTWLMGVGTRARGDIRDAYEHFAALHRKGVLFPTEAQDVKRYGAEFYWRVLHAAWSDANFHLKRLDANPNTDIPFILDGEVPMRMHQREVDGVVETWMALDQRGWDKTVNAAELRAAIFRVFAEEAHWELEGETDIWADNKRLQWWESAALFALS